MKRRLKRLKMRTTLGGSRYACHGCLCTTERQYLIRGKWINACSPSCARTAFKSMR